MKGTETSETNMSHLPTNQDLKNTTTVVSDMFAIGKRLPPAPLSSHGATVPAERWIQRL